MKLRIPNFDFLVYAGFTGIELPSHAVTASLTLRDDPVRYALRDSICLSYLADPAALGGRSNVDPYTIVKFGENRPEQISYSPIRDNSDYGRGLYTWLTGSFRNAHQRVAETNEQGVSHVRALGMYDYVPADLVRYIASDLTSSIWGVVIPSLSIDAFGQLSLGDTVHIVNNDVTLSYHPYSDASYYITDVLDAYKEKLDSAGENSVAHQFVIDGYRLRVSLATLSYNFKGESLEVKYSVKYTQMDLLFGHTLCELMKDSVVTVGRVPTNAHNPESDYFSPLLDRCAWRYTSVFRDYSSPIPNYHFGRWEDLVGTQMVDDGLSSECTIHSNMARVPDEIEFGTSRVRILEDFAKFVHKVEEAHGDITAGNFYSTSNALHEWLDIVSANMIEFCAELGGIASLIPNVAGLFRVYKSAKNLDLLGLGASILDVATDLKLWWDFGVKPTLSTIDEFVTKHDELFTRMPDLSGSRVLYGKFDYSTDDWYIDYRSKIRIRLDNSILLQAITGLNALGFLPSPGQFWDAVPFSFVVDWFFNIGGKLDAVDTQGMLLCLPCDVGTHSYSIETKSVPTELVDYGFFPSQLDTPRFVYYYRGVSVVLPSLRDSAYDFTPPSPPPWDTGFSFIYKILKF